MIKIKRLFFLLLSFVPLVLYGQITLDSIPDNRFTGVDSFLKVLNLKAFNTIYGKKLNGTWDLTHADYDTQWITYSHKINTSSAFPKASFQQNRKYEFSKGVDFEYLEYVNTSSKLFYTEGETIIDSQYISLSPLTGGSSDMIVFPPQTITHLNQDINPYYPVGLNNLQVHWWCILKCQPLH